MRGMEMRVKTKNTPCRTIRTRIASLAPRNGFLDDIELLEHLTI